MSAPYRLITIPPSHYCEKARWALELAGIDYCEERHPPILHYRPAKRAGGRSSTPVLVTGHGVYPDSTDILQFIQDREGSRWRPYLDDPSQRRECEGLEETFDTRLGPHTRRLAYYYLLQHRELFLESVLASVGGREAFSFRLLTPVAKFLMRRGMNITAASAERSLGFVRSIFGEVSERLADGRTYLVGDRFTAADLTFAALGAPVILPAAYGSLLPAPDALPADLLGLVEEFRSTAAGAFVLRCYEDHR